MTHGSIGGVTPRAGGQAADLMFTSNIAGRLGACVHGKYLDLWLFGFLAAREASGRFAVVSMSKAIERS